MHGPRFWLVAVGLWAALSLPALADTPDDLYLAAMAGDGPRLQKLLRQGANPNVPNAQGVPPLVAAARGGHEDAVRVLLAFGASVTQSDPGGRTALAEARARGQEFLVGMLERQTGFAYGLSKLNNRPGKHRLGGGVLEIKAQADGAMVMTFTKWGMGFSEAIMVARTLGGPGLDYSAHWFEPGVLSFPGQGGDGTFSPHVSALVYMSGQSPYQVRVVLK